MDSMMTQEDLARFLKDPKNSQKLDDLVEDIRDALMDYQVCAPNGLALNAPNICPRLRCNKKSMTKAVS